MAPLDPFFHLPASNDWNACIGRQGDEENYADGYIEAAIELAMALIEKAMYEKRDTLVLPILYNARHAIELTLKLIIGQLVEGGILQAGHPKNHDISSHFDFLEGHAIPDELFRDRLLALSPYVVSLSQIDGDGQELRFHQNRAGQRSMEGKALANIVVISESLSSLQRILQDLKHRSYSLRDEWRTSTRTSHCSRRDLVAIAEMLPERKEWASRELDECKKVIKTRFGLGSRQLSAALNKIQATRGLSYLIGIESDLVHLSDQKAKFLLSEWDKLHPPRESGNDRGMDYFLDRDWTKINDRLTLESEVRANIIRGLGEDELADAETIYYLARDGVFPELYEDSLIRKKAEFRARNDLQQEVYDLMSKTNFRRHFIEGLRILGRLRLSD